MRNGKPELERKPKGLDAPTPSEIAARAYDLAVSEAMAWLNSNEPLESMLRLQLGTHMHENRSRILADLRESIINHPAIPWWRK